MKEVSAGGVVYSHIENELKIQLIQDRYGRISLAKGKQEQGETLEQTALREIFEETGVHGKLGPKLDTIYYQFKTADERMIEKEVHYFLVEALGNELRVQTEEISGVAWFSPIDAWQKQIQYGYSNNKDVLRKALERLDVEVQ